MWLVWGVGYRAGLAIGAQGKGGIEGIPLGIRFGEPSGWMRVLLLIRSLNIGGAERQLVALAQGLKARAVDVRVLAFYPGGALRRELEQAGVPVADLGKRGRWDVLAFFGRLLGRLRRERPDVIYSFLATANWLGLIAGRLAGVRRVVWGIRASNVDLSRYDAMHRLDAFVAGRLARFADGIICNSRAGADYHAGRGYPAGKMMVVENGIDLERFRFDAEGRRRLRQEWGIGDRELVIGLAGRLDPMKDHPTFLRAAARLAREMTNVRCVCAGTGPEAYARTLAKLTAELGIGERVLWVGSQADMPAVYSAFDIACSSSSYGEGFSNAIAEAMACERVCVVTDVGDSARIVGPAGRVVPARHPEALAQACAALLALAPAARVALGREARARIDASFSAAAMVDRTLALLRTG